MFAGHVGVALALGRVERRINVGLFVAASLWLDGLLWILVLLGWETVEIPSDFPATHQPHFVFPYSHSLPAALFWSVLAGVTTWGSCAAARQPGLRLAAWVGAAVFSHWVLDFVVHRPELSLTGTPGHPAGLGLWNHMALALGIESAIVAFGLTMFLRSQPFAPLRSALLVAITLLLLGFTVLGMTVAPAPPSATAMAATSLATIVGACAFYGWLGRLKPSPVPPVHRT